MIIKEPYLTEEEYLDQVVPGNVIDILDRLPRKLVHTSITSPPYWAVRVYGTEFQIWGGDPKCDHDWLYYVQKGRDGGSSSKKRQTKDVKNFQNFDATRPAFCKECFAWLGELGNEPHFYLFVDHLLIVYDHLWPVLRDDGTCWINLGDSYWGSGGTFTSKINAYDLMLERFKEMNVYRSYKKLTKFHKSGYRPKSKCLIPRRFTIGMADRGWIPRNENIWRKPNAMTESAKDRLSRKYEDVLFFAKSERYYFDLEAIAVPIKESTRARNQYKQMSDTAKNHKFQRNIENPNIKNYTMKRATQETKNPGNVWDIPTTAYKGDHFAVFPEDLVVLPIRAASPRGGIVLDQFGGTNTTGIVAKKEQRHFISIELHPDYINQAEVRMNTGGNIIHTKSKDVKKYFRKGRKRVKTVQST